MSAEERSIWSEIESIGIVDASEKLVCLSNLSQARKKKAWHDISESHPSLAKLLLEPGLKEVMDYFDAELFVDASILPDQPVEPLRGRART